jgi:hypothetical protein
LRSTFIFIGIVIGYKKNRTNLIFRIMKTKLLLISALSLFSFFQTNAQRNSINAMNTEISDNLDLKAVASIFGDSRNLQDFERQLNDPKIQISNLDLNNDNEVDYLRVIETVDKQTHLIIIQAILDRDIYQDVATIDLEKDKYNKVHIQVVGNDFMYGQNYIYEPVYHTTPIIYSSFWSVGYYPYCSTWNWNYYPTYYYAWNPYPVFRYRNNVSVCINTYNNYNYVSSRRNNHAVVLYKSTSCNGFEREHPDYAFSRRNSSVNNHYELEQRRGVYSRGYQNKEKQYNSRNFVNNKYNVQRDYSTNRNNSTREITPQRTETQRDYSTNRNSSAREITPQRAETQRDYSTNRNSSAREIAPQRAETPRDYSINRNGSSREITPKSAEVQRDYSTSRNSTSREAASQRVESQDGSSRNRSNERSQNSDQSRQNFNSRESSSNLGNRRT